MPLIRTANAKLLYFAHIPKCAGTSIEAYLQKRFGALGFLDQDFSRRSALEAWSLSPPQHVPEVVRRNILPDNLFDHLFATIRHPATRLRSVYFFQRDVERAVPMGLPFDQWVASLPRILATDPNALHGHIRPMAHFVPQSAKVFKIEDGLDPLALWLDTVTESVAEALHIEQLNVTNERMTEPADASAPLTPHILKQISQFYAADYARFGYDVEPPDHGKADASGE